MTLTINVTQFDIKKGRENRKDIDLWISKTCPIALAMKRRKFTQGKDFQVCSDKIFIDPKEYACPKFIAIWIKRFDNNKTVKPFKKIFNLNED